MTTALVEMFRHNLWANLRLLDACATLDNSILHASVDGTYGEIGATLHHFVRSEAGYLYRLETGQPKPRENQEFPGVAILRERARQSGEGFIAIAEQHDPSVRYAIEWQDGNTYELPSAVYLAQAITHAAEHRSQIATILTQQGIEPPDVSVWAWCEETMIP
jgi:uncharacterized damage-inducible protein DinB